MSTLKKKNLNLNIRSLRVSATLGINEKSHQLMASGKEVFKFGLGQSPFPVPDIVVQALKDNAHQNKYLNVRGLPELREAVAHFHNRLQGLNDDGSDVLIGPGSKELMFLLQLVYYGDLVIPTPSWVSYAPQAQIIGRHVRWLKTSRDNRWLLSAEELERYCESDPDCPRIVILNYPSNPVGATYSEEELKDIAEVAKRYHVVLLSDEIYGEIHHDGKHVSIARFYPEGTIVSSGLSKWCGAGGWRLGTFLFPKGLRWLQDAMAVAASETFTSTSAPIQYAAIAAFEGDPSLDHYLSLSRKVLAGLGKRIHKMLTEAGIDVIEPEGGFYLMPDFTSMRQQLAKRSILTAETLCNRLLEETGVAILPGQDFGRPQEELMARMAYVDFDGKEALQAAEAYGNKPIDDDFLELYCPRMLRGVQAMCDWVKE